MNIIIIPSWYESKRRPTLGSFFKEQAIALAKNGHKVTLVFPGLVGSREVFDCNIKLKSYNENGITVYRVDTPGFGINRFEKIDEKLFSLKLKYIINKVIKKEGKPDIVHAHSCIWAGYSAVKIFKSLGIPVVITEHSTAFPKNEIKGYKERCVRTCINEASGIITVSNGLKESLGKYNDNNKEIKVIPNMFNEELFNSEHIKRTESKFRFVSVCYLSHKKGIDILLESFCKSFKGNNSVELLIGGQGEKYNDLVNLSIDLGIEKQVRFLGDLKRDDVANLIANSDVFALPSRFETFGVVFIEALALGKPIIASKCGGPEDIVNDKNGLLVEVENIEALS
ncbi:MAG: glycosyltransferase, partial [Paraclostridium sp.]